MSDTKDLATEQRETSDGSGCCYQKTGGCERHRAQSLIPGTPATMLGEAMALIERAMMLIETACPDDVVAERTLDDLDEARCRARGLKREADAREGR